MRTFSLPRMGGVQESLDMLQRTDLQSEDTLIVALTFRCNSRCRFCIVETEIEDELPDLDRQVLDRVFEANAASRTFKRLTLTGAEVTLLPDLAALAREACSRGGFEVVRIQTNGRRLKDADRVREYMAAGVREYFVSIHAPDAELDAYLTQSPPSFREMRAGVTNLVAQGARVISNTVLTADNYSRVAEIAALTVELGIRESQLWNFLHIGEAGQEAQLAPLDQAAPHVRAALEIWQRAGVTTTVKWLPQCLLGGFGELLDNHQPQMLIRDEFQRRMGTQFGFGCVHARSCSAFGKRCHGLHEGYVATRGDERELLRPL